MICAIQSVVLEIFQQGGYSTSVYVYFLYFLI